MTGQEIKVIRESLGMTQTQFGQLLGVHPLTVSKWERIKLRPSPYQVAMLQVFKIAERNKPDVGNVVVELLVGSGVALAIYTILQAAFENEREW